MTARHLRHVQHVVHGLVIVAVEPQIGALGLKDLVDRPAVAPGLELRAPLGEHLRKLPAELGAATKQGLFRATYVQDKDGSSDSSGPFGHLHQGLDITYTIYILYFYISIIVNIYIYKIHYRNELI